MMWKLFASLTFLMLSYPAAAQRGLDIEAGRRRFMEVCYRCHPLSSSEIPKTAAPIPRVSVYSFLAGLWNQSPNMLSAYEAEGWQPELLTREQVTQIFSFTQVIADRPHEGNPVKGERFVQSNRCLECHSIGGRGASDGLSWDHFASTLNASIIMAAVWSHRMEMLDAFQLQGVPSPKFERGELADLIAFMRQAGSPQMPMPVLMDMRRVSTDPKIFAQFECRRCHVPSEFSGKLELGLQGVTEALLAHAFMPEFSQPPLVQLSMTAADSMALAILVGHYAQLDQPGSRQEGERIFTRQRCIDCHDHPGQPNFDTEKALIGEIEDEWDLAMQIFNKVPRMVQKARVEAKAFPRLTPEEIRHLFAYICSSSPDCQPLVESGAK